MSSPKWNGKPKRFNPNRNFVMTDANSTRKFNPKSTFSPSFSPTPDPTTPPVVAPNTIPAGNPMGAATPPLGISGVSGLPDVEGLATAPLVTATDALEYQALYHPPLHPLQYHTYAPSPYRLHMAPLEPHERRADDLTLPVDVRKELLDRNDAILQVLPASVLPEFVHVYHSLVPLDLGKNVKETELWGHTAKRYKAISHSDGRTYCLLVLDDFELPSEHENALQVINKWKRVQSSAVVGVVEAFTTLAFGKMNGDSVKPAQSLVVVYEFYPMSQHLSSLPSPSEQVFWDIAIQLFYGLQAIHKRNLSCRGVMNERFILLQGKNRVRIGSLGVRDILEPGCVEILEDYKDLGNVLANISRSLVSSAAFVHFTTALVNGDVDEASSLLTPQLFRSMDHTYQVVDTLEDMLSKELQNGRLFRLLAKLEFVLNYKDAFDPRNPHYSLVLFKQYVFRQKTEAGKPSLNLAHALTALNKLDAGIDENVLLVSEDGKTRLVISYKELKHMFGTAFDQFSKS